MKQQDQMRNMIKDAAILFTITLIAGLILGFVYQLTKEPIAVQEKKALDKACQEVFQEANQFREMEGNSMEEATAKLVENGYPAQRMSENIMQALDASEHVIGYVLTVTSSEGYGGDITFTMGIQLDGSLNGISLLTIKETPGLGMKAEEVLQPQFADKQVDLFEYTKTGAMSENQIDTISGATITTEAIVNGVNAGLSYFQKELKEGGSGNE